MLFALTLFITSALFEALPYYQMRTWSRRKTYALVAVADARLKGDLK